MPFCGGACGRDEHMCCTAVQVVSEVSCEHSSIRVPVLATSYQPRRIVPMLPRDGCGQCGPCKGSGQFSMVLGTPPTKPSFSKCRCLQHPLDKQLQSVKLSIRIPTDDHAAEEQVAKACCQGCRPGTATHTPGHATQCAARHRCQGHWGQPGLAPQRSPSLGEGLRRVQGSV